MVVETKLNIGDDVWSTYSGKAFCGPFLGMKGPIFIVGYNKFGPDQCVFVTQVFKTKEELIESFFN